MSNGTPETKEKPTETTAVTVRQEPQNYLALVKVGEALYRSGMFPTVRNAFGAYAVVQYGHEMGVPPMMALQNINIISGKLACDGQLMLSQALKRGVRYKIIEETANACVIDFTRDGQTYRAEFREADAKAAGLLGKQNWKMYPRDMYFWRAVAKGVRRVAPDAIMGAYTPDELTQGEVINVDAVEIDATAASPPSDNVREAAFTVDGDGAPPPSTDVFIWPMGKHKGTAVTALPENYLQWVVDNMDKAELKAAAKAELDRRVSGAPEPTEDHNPDPPETEPAANAALIEQVKVAEGNIWNLDSKAAQEEMLGFRNKNTGKMVLEQLTDDELNTYLTLLQREGQ